MGSNGTENRLKIQPLFVFGCVCTPPVFRTVAILRERKARLFALGGPAGKPPKRLGLRSHLPFWNRLRRRSVKPDSSRQADHWAAVMAKRRIPQRAWPSPWPWPSKPPCSRPERPIVFSFSIKTTRGRRHFEFQSPAKIQFVGLVAGPGADAMCFMSSKLQSVRVNRPCSSLSITPSGFAESRM